MEAPESFLSLKETEKIGLDFNTIEPVDGTNGVLFTNIEYGIRSE